MGAIRLTPQNVTSRIRKLRRTRYNSVLLFANVFEYITGSFIYATNSQMYRIRNALRTYIIQCSYIIERQ